MQVSKSKKLNAEIVVRLREAFGPPENAIFFEVAAGTGYEGRRRVADAVAMGMWPSRGMQVTGFEIKVNRHDWLREKDNPEKAEEIAAYCNHWALVTAHGVAEPKEIPHAWYWYELDEDGKLHLRQRGSETEAKPLDRSFVASLLRSAGKADASEIEFEVERRLEKAHAEIESRVESLVRQRPREAQQLLEKYRPIEDLLGGATQRKFVENSELAAAVRMVLDSGIHKTYGGLASLQRELIAMGNKIEAALGRAK